jgi:hypothetical protein
VFDSSATNERNRRIDPTLAEAVGKAENGACANGTRLRFGQRGSELEQWQSGWE